MKKKLFIAILFYFCQVFSTTTSLETNFIDNNTQQLQINLDLDESELLYKDSIDISVDSPYIELSPWQYDKNALEKYDPISKETRTVFEQQIKISMEAQKRKDTIDDSFLYLTYQTNKQATPQQRLFQLHFPKPEIEQPPSKQSISHAAVPLDHKQHQSSSFLHFDMQSCTNTLSCLVEQTKSLPIRLVLVFLLGILLSLTPCIYPMIPITVGVLQAQKSSSFIYNFLHSFAYTLGISTTFAAFGLLASFTGPIYGKLFMSPFSVGILVLFLGYLGLSMFGFYDVQLPKFLQFKNHATSNGSLISSFLFGTASGTIASPCVSPGLILLLSIVASLGNIFLGFLLLFAFGVGLSTPLLLIGTFSSSVSMLPRAGLWMVEIKKLFGIMLFGVCFYYLSNIIPHNLLMYLVSIFIAITGFYYLWSSHENSSTAIKKYSSLIGFCLVVTSITLFGFNLQEQFFNSSDNNESSFWLTNYQQALQKARNENKLLFLDFWAEYCSICKAINKKLTSNPNLKLALKKTVPVSINGTNDNQEPYKTLKDKFSIKGFPTYLLVDPTNEKILKEWHSEIYGINEQVFIDKLEQFL